MCHPEDLPPAPDIILKEYDLNKNNAIYITIKITIVELDPSKVLLIGV